MLISGDDLIGQTLAGREDFNVTAKELRDASQRGKCYHGETYQPRKIRSVTVNMAGSESQIGLECSPGRQRNDEKLV